MTTKKTPKKTDALTLRLDPRTKYLIEMSSRLGHQSITGVVESAVKLQAQHRKVALSGIDTPLSIAAELLWAPEESERLVNMIQFAPALLSHEEICIKTVLEASEDIFFNAIHVGPENFKYRESFFKDRKGSLVQDDAGDLWFITPRTALIRLSWMFIKKRAEQLADTGMLDPFTVESLELLLGRPLESIPPYIKVPSGDLDEGEEISVQGADREYEDLVGSVTRRG